jgi:transposase-like protein
MCPNCKTPTQIFKRGRYRRPSDKKLIQRFQCKNCQKSFSSQTSSFDYRLRKRRINQRVFLMLAKGMSQRGCAQVLGVDPKTISRRVWRFGRCSKAHLKKLQKSKRRVSSITFDEMETFEHTKLKPLTIPLAVETNSRKVLALDVGKIAAKGPLASLSRSKYGYRKCQRRLVLDSLFDQIKNIATPECIFLSDESQHYPRPVKRFFKNGIHKQYKGRKPAVVGQGEMKKGGFDPLFSLNQTAAMFRDNIKRLTRRTWCTTKRVDRLLDFLHIYAFYHNQRIDGVKRPRIFDCKSTN